LDIAAATSKHFPIAALCSSGASGTGNINAQLGKVESFFIAEPLTQDVLNDSFEEHQSMPTIFSTDLRFKGTGDELQIGVPVPGVLNINDRLSVLGSSAQMSTGACFMNTPMNTVIQGGSQNLLTHIPLTYTGRVKVSLDCVYDISASPGFHFFHLRGNTIASQSASNDASHLWVAYAEGPIPTNTDRGRVTSEFVLDIENLHETNGADLTGSILSMLYFEPNADISVLFGAFSIDLLDYVPGVDDQCLVFRHSSFGKDVTLNATVDCYSSFQHTVDNAFSSTTSGTWLPTSEHCAMQQRLLAGDVLSEALKVGRAGFFKNLWKGISNVGKALLPVARKFAPELSKVADTYVPGSGQMITNALGRGAALGYHQ
jgi:hypothetical protein